MPDENSLIYGRIPGIDHPSDIALYTIDLGTGRSEKIPGTDGLYSPLWSPDGHELAAVDASNERLFLVDLKTGKRSQLSGPEVYPVWSADSHHLYYGAGDHQIFRVRVPDGHAPEGQAEEEVLHVTFRLAASSFGLAPDGAPIILREHGNYDIYALSLATR
jgi:Tol biopolymer transport system component